MEAKRDGGSRQKIAMNMATSCLKKSGDPDEDRDEEAFFIRAFSTLAGTPPRCKRKSLRMALPFPGVTFPVSSLQIGDGQMQVALGGRKALVSEQRLDVAQVRVVFEQMRGAGVPPDVATDFAVHSRQSRPFLDDVAQDVSIQRPAA